MTANGNGHHGPAQPGRLRQVAPQPVEVLQEQFESVRGANQARLADLERRGMAMDPLSFAHARIDSLIDFISRSVGPDGARWSLLARLEFENQIAGQLAQVEQQATMAQLAQGARFTPAMIAEMARTTGLFRRA